MTKENYESIISGDPHIKTISGEIYQIPNNWKYIKLLSNDIYEIAISAECGSIDLSEQLFMYSNDKYLIRTNNNTNFPEFIINNNYFRKIRIQYKYEFIEICPDTLNITKRSAISSHIRVLSIKQGFNIEKGIYSLRNNKNYPVHNDLTQIKISIASLVTIDMKSDLITDERHELNIKLYFDNINKCSGAIISNHSDNCLDSILHSLPITNID